jgi:hypothetical protein
VIDLLLQLSPYAEVVYGAIGFVGGVCLGLALTSPSARWVRR